LGAPFSGIDRSAHEHRRESLSVIGKRLEGRALLL
jgi:hypothetical protein